MKDYYKTLNVSPDSDAAAIKRAYKHLARECHPDVCPGGPERFLEIQEAYQTLSDEKRRADYDRKRANVVPHTRSSGIPSVPPEPMRAAGPPTARTFEPRYVDTSAGGFRSRQVSPDDARTIPAEPLSASPRYRAGVRSRRPGLRRGWWLEDAGFPLYHRGGGAALTTVVCPRCGGRGRVGWFLCPLCGGSGNISVPGTRRNTFF